MLDYVGNSLCDRVLDANLSELSDVTCLADFRCCPRPSFGALSALTRFHLRSLRRIGDTEQLGSRYVEGLPSPCVFFCTSFVAPS